MPLFDFHCADCDATFEELVRQGADAPACPGCGSASTRKLPSAFAVGGGAAPRATFSPGGG